MSRKIHAIGENTCKEKMLDTTMNWTAENTNTRTRTRIIAETETTERYGGLVLKMTRSISALMLIMNPANVLH